MSSPVISRSVPGLSRCGNVGLAGMDPASLDQRRRAPTLWSLSPTSRSASTVPVPVSRERRSGDPVAASTTPRSSRSVRSARISAASSTTRPTEARWHCPCHEGNFEPLTGDVISGPPTRPLGRIEVEVRRGRQIWALGDRPMKDPELRGRRTAAAVLVYLILLLSMQVFLVSVVLKRSWPTTSAWRGQQRRVGRDRCLGIVLPAVPRPMTQLRQGGSGPGRGAVSGLLRHGHGDRHRRRWRIPAGSRIRRPGTVRRGGGGVHRAAGA